MNYHYTFLVLITLFISCKDPKPKSSVLEVKPQIDTLKEILKKGAKDLAEREFNPIERSVKDSAFKVFFKDFKKALKSKNRKKVLTFIHFPLHELHPCYLWTPGLDRYSDTAGIGKKTFLSIYTKVFDDESSWIVDAHPDSLYDYDEYDEEEYHLLRKVDKSSPVYEYPVFYANDNHEGNKIFFFGKIKGYYKLFYIRCEGHIDSRGKY